MPPVREYADAEVTLLHPVVPEKILAIGLNYRSHADESELDVPDRAGRLRQVAVLAHRAR